MLVAEATAIRTTAYHGTPAEFKRFRARKGLIFFAKKKNYASQFAAGTLSRQPGKPGQMISAKLSMAKPLDLRKLPYQTTIGDIFAAANKQSGKSEWVPPTLATDTGSIPKLLRRLQQMAAWKPFRTAFDGIVFNDQAGGQQSEVYALFTSKPIGSWKQVEEATMTTALTVAEARQMAAVKLDEVGKQRFAQFGKGKAAMLAFFAANILDKAGPKGKLEGELKMKLRDEEDYSERTWKQVAKKLTVGGYRRKPGGVAGPGGRLSNPTWVAESIDEGKPTGKVQVALLKWLKGRKSGDVGDVQYRDVPASVKQIQSAAKALAKKGLIDYDGMVKMSVKEARDLPAFKITTASGHSWTTSMAKGITLAKAKKYFLGQSVDVGSGAKEKMEKVTKVVQVAEATTDEAVDPEVKEIAKAIREYAKKKGLKVRVQSSKGKAKWIRMSLKAWRTDKFPNELRLKAVKIIGGTPPDPTDVDYGNIQSTSIALRAHQWKALLKGEGVRVAESMHVAKTIRAQLGRQAAVMMGAKQFSGGKDYLQFRIGKNKLGASIIKITLTPQDLYDIEFGRIRSVKGSPTYKVLKTLKGIFVDKMHAAIEKTTGLRLSLTKTYEAVSKAAVKGELSVYGVRDAGNTLTIPGVRKVMDVVQRLSKKFGKPTKAGTDYKWPGMTLSTGKKTPDGYDVKLTMESVYEAKLPFKLWMKKVDVYVSRKTGMSYRDLPDVPYRDWYEDGDSPQRAAARAVKMAMESVTTEAAGDVKDIYAAGLSMSQMGFMARIPTPVRDDVDRALRRKSPPLRKYGIALAKALVTGQPHPDYEDFGLTMPKAQGVELRLKSALRRYTKSKSESVDEAKMTLAAWGKKFKIKPMRHKGGAMYVPDRAGEPSHKALFALTDYRVSSVTAGTVWLTSKKSESVDEDATQVLKSRLSGPQLRKAIAILPKVEKFLQSNKGKKFTSFEVGKRLVKATGAGAYAHVLQALSALKKAGRLKHSITGDKAQWWVESVYTVSTQIDATRLSESSHGITYDRLDEATITYADSVQTVLLTISGTKPELKKLHAAAHKVINRGGDVLRAKLTPSGKALVMYVAGPTPEKAKDYVRGLASASKVKVESVEVPSESRHGTALNESVGKPIAIQQIVERAEKIGRVERASEDPMEPLKKTYTQFIRQGDVFAPSGPGVFTDKLNRHAYRIERSMSGVQFRRVKPKTDELYHFKNSVMEGVINEIDRFWDLQEDYAKLGIMHNRGILLEGPPGTGKSSVIQQIVEMMVGRGDVVFFSDRIGLLKEALTAFREIEDKRNVVVVLEDADEHIGYEQNSFLQLLDGDQAVEGVLYLATTNHLSRFPERLKRPGRFDKIIHVGPPPYEGRLVYLKNKIGNVEKIKEIERISKETDGMSFGHLRELVLAVYALKEPVADVIARLKTHGEVSEGLTVKGARMLAESKLGVAQAQRPFLNRGTDYQVRVKRSFSTIARLPEWAENQGVRWMLQEGTVGHALDRGGELLIHWPAVEGAPRGYTSSHKSAVLETTRMEMVDPHYINEGKWSQADAVRLLVPNKSVMTGKGWYTITKRDIDADKVTLKKATFNKSNAKSVGPMTMSFSGLLKKIKSGSWGVNHPEKGYTGRDSERFGEGTVSGMRGGAGHRPFVTDPDIPGIPVAGKMGAGNAKNILDTLTGLLSRSDWKGLRQTVERHRNAFKTGSVPKLLRAVRERNGSSVAALISKSLESIQESDGVPGGIGYQSWLVTQDKWYAEHPEYKRWIETKAEAARHTLESVPHTLLTKWRCEYVESYYESIQEGPVTISVDAEDPDDAKGAADLIQHLLRQHHAGKGDKPEAAPPAVSKERTHSKAKPKFVKAAAFEKTPPSERKIVNGPTPRYYTADGDEWQEVRFADRSPVIHDYEMKAEGVSEVERYIEPCPECGNMDMEPESAGQFFCPDCGSPVPTVSYPALESLVESANAIIEKGEPDITKELLLVHLADLDTMSDDVTKDDKPVADVHKAKMRGFIKQARKAVENEDKDSAVTAMRKLVAYTKKVIDLPESAQPTLPDEDEKGPDSDATVSKEAVLRAIADAAGTVGNGDLGEQVNGLLKSLKDAVVQEARVLAMRMFDKLAEKISEIQASSTDESVEPLMQILIEADGAAILTQWRQDTFNPVSRKPHKKRKRSRKEIPEKLLRMSLKRSKVTGKPRFLTLKNDQGTFHDTGQKPDEGEYWEIDAAMKTIKLHVAETLRPGLPPIAGSHGLGAARRVPDMIDAPQEPPGHGGRKRYNLNRKRPWHPLIPQDVGADRPASGKPGELPWFARVDD